MSDEGIVDRLIAASHDERLSTGMLYREAAHRIVHLHAENIALQRERDEAVALLHQTEDKCMALRAERDEAVVLLREAHDYPHKLDSEHSTLRARVYTFLAKLEAK